jgi:hypothetical protein
VTEMVCCARASPTIEGGPSTTCALPSSTDSQVWRERIADRYGVRSGGLAGECLVTHQALAYTLPEDHECFSHLVCLPARRKESFPCHDFDSPFINENGSRVIAEDTAFFALLTSDFLGQWGCTPASNGSARLFTGSRKSRNSLPI